MAKIDLARRAEIGRDRRAKTREQVMTAARALYAEHGFESVSVDDIVRRAKVARGTFYIHFADIDELRAAVAHELAEALEQVRRPQRMRESDPLERIASGCFAFIHQALLNPEWGNLVARAASALPTVGRAARENLAEDLRRAVRQKRIAATSPELGAAIVTGIVFQTMRLAGEKRWPDSDAPAAIVAILLALGVSRRVATAVVRRITHRYEPGNQPAADDT